MGNGDDSPELSQNKNTKDCLARAARVTFLTPSVTGKSKDEKNKQKVGKAEHVESVTL